MSLEAVINYQQQSVEQLDKNAMYRVINGYVDLFAHTCTPDGVQTSGSIHLARFEKGDVYFFFTDTSTSIQIITKLYLSSEIERFSLDDERVLEEVSAVTIEHWFEQLSLPLAACPVPHAAQIIKPSARTCLLKQGQLFYAQKLLWLLLSNDVLVDDELHQQSYKGIACLSQARMYKSNQDHTAKILSTEEAMHYLGFDLLKDFWQKYLNVLPLLIQRQFQSRQQFYVQSQQQNKCIEQNIHRTLSQPIHSDPDLNPVDEPQEECSSEWQTVHQTLALCADSFRIKKTAVCPKMVHSQTIAEKIKYMAQHMNMDAHSIQLETGWEKNPVFSYLGFTEDGKLWAILPAWNNRYQLIDPQTKKKYSLNKKMLETIKNDAYVIVPSVQEEDVLSFKKFLQHTFLGCKLNVIKMLMLYLIIAALGIIHPIATGMIVKHGLTADHIIPMSQLIWLLSGTTLCIGIFSLLRSLLFTRFEIVTLYHLQSMVMMRVFKLELSFFDRYATGDLCQRILMVDTVAKAIGPNQLGIVLSFIFSLVSLVPMFYYAWQWSLIIVLIVVASFTFSTIIAVTRQLGLIEGYWQGIGETSALMYQIVNGISRIKIFCKERFVEAHWMRIYHRARFKLFQTYRLAVWRFTLSNNIQLLTLCLLITPAALWHHPPLPLEGFVIFYTALIQFMSGFISFSLYSNGMISAVCSYRRLKPALDAPVENTHHARSSLAVLTGAIDIRNVFFNYPNTNRTTLNGLTCSITPGEHVAFVGLSGSGKSTLLKLLLGFYAPQQGQIFFDNQSLQQVNLSSLRRQIGTVFQDSKLFTGSILDNLIGHQTQLTEAEAWRVVALVGLKPFILSLPMKMHTIVSQHMNVISGGQKQLLLIARALVGEPRILLLDEATNSLDNKAQALVVKNISHLPMTCISIAHRLSTVRYADKVMVIANGTIVETGNYEQLLDLKGHFYRLVKQQNVT